MLNLPPWWVRRLLLAPAALVVSLLIVAASPLLFLLAFIADLLLPGDRRTVRLVGFICAYAAMEVVGLVALTGMWLASGLGWKIGSQRWQATHYSFMGWWLHIIEKAARSLFHIRIHIEDRPKPRPGPVLVFSRHAGPGNSMLLIGTILIGYRRRPRIVMLAKLQWEPLFDIMLNRVPNRFIRHDPQRREIYVNAIGELASGLSESDAFVLFPEGKDFTPRVRQKAIEYLRSKGHDRAAQRAEGMEHVLPPRHNGVMAALRSAPHADVVFVAHAVLEEVGTFKQLWSRIPLSYPIVARYWRIPPEEVPTDKDALIDWLYGWWEKIDHWIEDRERAIASGDLPVA